MIVLPVVDDIIEADGSVCLKINACIPMIYANYSTPNRRNLKLVRAEFAGFSTGTSLEWVAIKKMLKVNHKFIWSQKRKVNAVKMGKVNDNPLNLN